MYAPLNQTLVSKSLKYVNTTIPSKSLHIRLRLEKLQLHNILKRWKTKTDMTFTGLSKIFQWNYTIKHTSLHEVAVTVNIYYIHTDLTKYLWLKVGGLKYGIKFIFRSFNHKNICINYTSKYTKCNIFCS